MLCKLPDLLRKYHYQKVMLPGIESTFGEMRKWFLSPGPSIMAAYVLGFHRGSSLRVAHFVQLYY